MDDEEIKPVLYDPPKPISVLPQTEEAKPFPVAHLNTLKDVVQVVQRQVNVPLPMAVGCALAVASSATQAIANVETVEKGKKPISLNILTICGSGDRKTACDSLLAVPFKRFQDKRQKIYDQQKEEFDPQHEAWKIKREEILKKIKTGLKSKDEIFQELSVLGKEPLEPLKPHFLVSEATMEGLVKLFSESYPSLALLNDEGGMVFGGMAMNKDNRLKTIAILAKLWDGASISRDRAGEGRIMISDKRLSVHLMAQVGIAKDFLKDPLCIEQGILARFLTSQPESLAGTREEIVWRDENHPALVDFYQKIEACLNYPFSLKEGSRNELDLPLITLSDGARLLLEEFYRTTERKQGKGKEYEIIRSHASKACENACRIAGVMTLLHDPHSREITIEVMNDAIPVMQWYLDESLRITENTIPSEDLLPALGLQDFIQKKYKEGQTHFCIADHQSSVSSKCNLRQIKVLEKAVRILMDCDQLIPDTEVTPYQKLRPVRFRIIPLPSEGEEIAIQA